MDHSGGGNGRSSYRKFHTASWSNDHLQCHFSHDIHSTVSGYQHLFWTAFLHLHFTPHDQKQFGVSSILCIILMGFVITVERCFGLSVHSVPSNMTFLKFHFCKLAVSSLLWSVVGYWSKSFAVKYHQIAALSSSSHVRLFLILSSPNSAESVWTNTTFCIALFKANVRFSYSLQLNIILFFSFQSVFSCQALQISSVRIVKKFFTVFCCFGATCISRNLAHVNKCCWIILIEKELLGKRFLNNSSKAAGFNGFISLNTTFYFSGVRISIFWKNSHPHNVCFIVDYC